MVGGDGIAGNGGACGDESRNGLALDIVFRDEYNISTGKISVAGEPATLKNNASKSVGMDGVDGYNGIGVENPGAVDLINPSHVINNYKNFVRRSVSIDGQNLDTNFVEDIEEYEHIQSLYDTLGFVDEMLGIEMQYFELKNKASLTPYYGSLLKRTAKLSQNFKEPIANKGVLAWLYTTITTRLSNVAKKPTLIVDLPEYLNEIEGHILKFRHNEIEVNVNDQQYSLNSEIQSVNAYIKNQILPELENIFAEIGSHVSTLIDELFERQYKFKDPIEDPETSETPETPETSENDTILSPMLRDKKRLFKAINTLTDAYSSMDMGISMMIGTEIDKWISGSDDFSLDLTSEFIEPTLKIGRHREKYQLLIEQLNDIERELNQFSTLEIDSNSLTNVTRNVAELKTDLTEQLQSGVLDPYDVDYKRDELISLFEEKQSELHLSKDLSTCFDIILAILKLRAVSIDFYRRTSVEDISELLNLYEITNKMEEEAGNVDLEIENIYDTITEQYLKIDTSVNEISRQLINKSHFELDESRWRTMGTVRDVKAFFRKMGNETVVVELLCRSIEKLDETIIFLFDAYDHIGNLNKSVNGFVDTISGELQYSHDSTLNDATKKLEKIIQMNVILEKYELAVKAFEKRLFPFANKILMSDLQLPRDLQPDDNEKLAKVVINRFYYLKEKVKSLDVLLIGTYDDFVLSDIEFSSKETSLVGPFFKYEFSSENYEKKLKLLRGEEIQLEANINEVTRFYGLDAIKFNEIGIKLIIDSNKQNALNLELEKYVVTMTMIGKSDYRCDKKIHSFALDGNISFTYSFKRNSKGQPVMKNYVYQKIYGNYYFLSPYTTWKIKIQNLSTGNLSSFEKDKIDLELFGRGQYIPNNHIRSEVCTELN